MRARLEARNRRVTAEDGCRLLVRRLPSKGSWRNPIEPEWAHGKRAAAEPTRELATAELSQRLCDHCACDVLQPRAQQVA